MNHNKFKKLLHIFEDHQFNELTENPSEIRDPGQDIIEKQFKEILDFVNENKREPQETTQWSNERKLWSRLRGYRSNPEISKKLRHLDINGLLETENKPVNILIQEEPKISSLESIFELESFEDDFNELLDVSRYRKTIRAADNIGRRKKARNFDKYAYLFRDVHEDIASGKRKIISFNQYDLEEGRFYVQNGVVLYIVSIGKFFTDNSGYRNAKMHVVYENGTENNELLFRSLASSLYATERHGRMITEPLDDNEMSKIFRKEYTTGYIYILKSLSDNQQIKSINNLYKIGFTKNDVNKRISNAKNEATYLYAPVQIVTTIEVKNLDARILERTIHNLFADKRIIFEDYNYKKAEEWYVINLEEIIAQINYIISTLHQQGLEQ